MRAGLDRWATRRYRGLRTATNAAAMAPVAMVASASTVSGHGFALPQKSSVPAHGTIVLIAPKRRSAPTPTKTPARSIERDRSMSWASPVTVAIEQAHEDHNDHDGGQRDEKAHEQPSRDAEDEPRDQVADAVGIVSTSHSVSVA